MEASLCACVLVLAGRRWTHCADRFPHAATHRLLAPGHCLLCACKSTAQAMNWMLRNALDASLHDPPSSGPCLRLCASQALDALARWKGGAACKAQGWMPACPSWPAGSSPAHVNPGASRGCGATPGLILSGESGSLARCCAEGGAKCFAIRMTPHPLGASNVPTEALIGGAERNLAMRLAGARCAALGG